MVTPPKPQEELQEIIDDMLEKLQEIKENIVISNHHDAWSDDALEMINDLMKCLEKKRGNADEVFQL